MPIERKTGLFYELMIRGRWNPAEGNLGEITTYQLQTGSALIDTDSNTLVAPYAPDPARDLTKEQAVTFLGEKFADFIGQLAHAQKQIADLQAAEQREKSRADEALTSLEAAQARIKEANPDAA